MPLGWIDFSKSERNKVFSVLDMLTERGTLDELGIAPIRDGFANLFFPGTSTIQTRAKYFFVVPYVCKDLEKSDEGNPARVMISLDAMERKCAEQFLLNNYDEAGVVGKRSLASGNWVKRTPADIYWAGLRQYGIFAGGNISLSEYVRAMCALKNQKNTLKKLGNRRDDADEGERDDAGAGDIRKFQFWNVSTYKREWLSSLQMELTAEEGVFLKNQIIRTHPDSMMAFILKNNLREVLDIEGYHMLSAIMDRFPESIQDDYYLALKFSDFIYAIRVVYNVIVSDGLNEEANQELERLKPDFEEIGNAVDIEYIMDRLKVFNNPMLFKFLTQSKEYMVSGDMESLIKCIKNREINLKGQSRAKTSHPGEFDSEVWFGGGALDYRFSNAKVIIRDIFESEVAADA